MTYDDREPYLSQATLIGLLVLSWLVVFASTALAGRMTP
jgi:hypothetical protein